MYCESKSGRGCHDQLPTFFFCNPRSLNNKLNELSVVLESNNVDVAGIAESWFPANLPPELSNIDGYCTFSRPTTDERGGGVALYVKNSIKCKVLTDIFVPDDIEALWVSVRPSRLPRFVTSFVVGVIYYPPNSPVAEKLIDHLSSTINSVLSKHPGSGICIVGDFNHLDLNCVLSSSIKQVVNKPTRDSSILDKILTNVGSKYLRPVILPPIGLSDHNCVLFKPKVTATKSNVIRIKHIVRPMPDSKLRAYGQWLVDYEWMEVYNENNMQTMCSNFYQTLHESIDKYFPKRVVKRHPTDKPWISSQIKALIAKRQKAFANNHDHLWRQLRNKINRLIRRAKNLFYVNKIQHLKRSSPSEWYKNIRVMTGQSSQKELVVPNCNNHMETANAVCTHLSSIGTKIGPVVFCAMINNVFPPENAPVKHFKYVDDLTLIEYRNIVNQSELQSCATALHDWASGSNMKLNPKKCCTMDISFSKRNFIPSSISLNDHVLKAVDTVKVLGVMLQANLKWDSHAEYCQKG
ncbi:uncharacterized protein LOC117101127 [Anneissia japonica]|uniref:uncharacterized protein LOC117101127 n=1 Tax=Anneissia japonica TaxID=1529436 RepID=UPI0014258AFA|nr:uncharacterized protein LOC117101127 [Anneissia japonica]